MFKMSRRLVVFCNDAPFIIFNIDIITTKNQKNMSKKFQKKMSMSTFIFIGHFLFLFQNMCIFFIAHIISSECFFAPFMKGGCGDFFLVISNECEKSTDSDFRTPLIPLTKGDYYTVISNECEKSISDTMDFSVASLLRNDTYTVISNIQKKIKFFICQTF